MSTATLQSEAEREALAKLEAMPDEEFLLFVAKLPARVKLLAKSGMCDWRTVLPAWYVKLSANVSDERDQADGNPHVATDEVNPDDIPF